jgi:hypothetical protein
MSGYPHRLIYFMWKWQVSYMISCKVSAESLFSQIDRRLMATAFLIGFKSDNKDNRPLICFEPEKMAFLSNDFSEIEEITEKFASIDPLKNMYYSGGMQGEMDIRRREKNFREAIKDILDRSAAFTDKIHFVAPAVLRDGYNVYVILQLDKTIYSNYVFLRYVDPQELLSRHLSLIDATINNYLEDCAYRLYLPEAGRDRGPERDYDDMLRAAAKSFSFTIALAGRSGNFYDLYPACNELSLVNYEGKENRGHLIICRKDHPALDISLELLDPFSIKQNRKLRKLLELTDEKTGVITNGEIIIGLGKINHPYDTQMEDVFHVYFRGIHCYDIMHESQPLLLMRHGRPEQAGQFIIYERFAQDAKRIFADVTDNQIEQMYMLSNAAIHSGSGCMLVFLADADKEAKRLANQSISIKPKKLDETAVQVLTSIDGAIIVDLDGFAHAKGVILDGVVGLDGDSSRGSRYNSALTYCEYRGWQKPTMIVVVSEDGMVDVIPQLMPQIRHSEIIQFIKTLESLNSEETFNDNTYYDVMNMLITRSFYLTKEECDHINILNKSLSELDHKSGKTVWRVFDDFAPNPKMNDRFYVDEK